MNVRLIIVLDWESMSSASATVYAMPFAIQSASTVTSDIKRHFTNSFQENDQQISASFRGRPLNGTQLSLPADYIGLLTQSSQPVSTFDQLTYFNLDCPTSSKDPLVRSIHWLSLAKVLHE